jgi:hypothetical protein
MPTSVAAIDLTIGAVEGPDEYIFGGVSGLADGVGRIYVADRQTSVYASGGFFARLERRAPAGDPNHPHHFSALLL